MLFAALLDGLDGRIARLIDGTSEFGKELDSLTDFVSFGIAPAFILFFWELKNYGKPEEISKKISLVKMNKFKEENALLTQAWVMEPKKKVQDVLKELAINDLKIKEFSRIKIGE